MNDFFKDTKWLKTEDLAKLGITNTISVKDGPVVLINDKPHTAECYYFDNIEEVKKMFETNTLIKHLVYDFEGDGMPGFLSNTKFDLNVGDKLIINRGMDTTEIEINTQSEMKITYTDPDINKCYNKFLVRIFKPTEITADSFKNCNAIDDCIIKTVENKLSDATTKLDEESKKGERSDWGSYPK